MCSIPFCVLILPGGDLGQRRFQLDIQVAPGLGIFICTEEALVLFRVQAFTRLIVSDAVTFLDAFDPPVNDDELGSVEPLPEGINGSFMAADSDSLFPQESGPRCSEGCHMRLAFVPVGVAR